MPVIKILIQSLLLASVLFVCTMIDTRGTPIEGTCLTKSGYYIYPVANLDCTGRFFNGQLP